MMPQSLAQVWIHLVFSTKERRAYLKVPEMQDEMYRMLAYHVEEAGCVSASVGGSIDHVHLLVCLSRTITIAKLTETIKVETSKWAKGKSNCSPTFSWQSGYGAFSVSHSNRNVVDRYIRNQAKHHRKFTFQEEFRELCRRHNLELDERYVWE